MAKLLKKKQSGFTLIELMIVVVIIGVLAATAIPAFLRFVKRSKTAEAPNNLKGLFDGASSYFNRSTVGRQWTSTSSSLSRCLLAPGTITTGNTPGPEKTIIQPAALTQFQAIDWGVTDGVYFVYSATTASAGVANCSVPVGTRAYTFTANSDLDGDTVLSTYELSAGVMEDGLSHLGVWTNSDRELE